MPRASGSSFKVRFREPQSTTMQLKYVAQITHLPVDFTFVDDLNLWSCNVCIGPHQARQHALSAQAAMRHEKGGSHFKRVQASKEHLESWKPQPDLQAWLQVPDYDDLFERRGEEQMQHVDSLKDLIPFWQRQVEAAERGENLRMEAFLDALYDGKAKDPWNTNWDTPTPAWAVDTGQEQNPWDTGAPGWAVDAAEVDRSSDTAHGQRSEVANHERGEGSTDGSGGEDPAAVDAFMFVENVARMESISGDRKRSLHDFYKVCTSPKVNVARKLIYITVSY